MTRNGPALIPLGVQDGKRGRNAAPAEASPDTSLTKQTDPLWDRCENRPYLGDSLTLTSSAGT